MNAQKTIINGSEFENVPAEVVRVDFTGADKEKLYTIYCKLLGSFGSQTQNNVIAARALDANIKNIPIKGEVVMLIKGPTAYNSALRTGQEYYYTNPISIQSSIHHNGIPGVTDFTTQTTQTETEKRKNAEDGAWNKVENKLNVTKTIDPGFPERIDVYPIQPYPGDIIIEGRWGQSIRLGSTIDERRSYPQRPLWKKGLGDTGNPILIISNGTNPEKKPFNQFILEDPDKDDSSIWMTSGHELQFTPASKALAAAQNRKVDLHTANQWAGNQILISTDRIILNARKQEIMAFSAEGIGLSSDKGVTIDGGQVVEVESSRINLGINAVSPVLLGDKTMQWLGDLCDALAQLCSHITSQTHPTGTGPSGPPINAGSFSAVASKIKGLRGSLKSLPSDLVFVCEKGGGPSKAEQDEAKKREETKSGYVKPTEELNNDPLGTDDDPVTPSATNLVTITKEIDDVEEKKKKILENLKSTTGDAAASKDNSESNPEGDSLEQSSTNETPIDTTKIDQDPPKIIYSSRNRSKGVSIKYKGVTYTVDTKGTESTADGGGEQEWLDDTFTVKNTVINLSQFAGKSPEERIKIMDEALLGSNPQGTNGTSGTSGTSGTNGTSGTSGSTTPNPEDVIPNTISPEFPNGITFSELGLDKTKMKLINGRWDYNGNIQFTLDKPMKKFNQPDGSVLREIPIPFGNVNGIFNCSNLGLKSLTNAPQEVDSFDCSKNKNITSLVGGPKKATFFDASKCNLVNLEGSPTYVDASFNVSRNNLQSLNGIPKQYGSGCQFELQGNVGLKSLSGIESTEDKPIAYLNVRECNLTNETIFEGVTSLIINRSKGQFSGGSQVNGKQLDENLIKETTGAFSIYVKY